MSSSNGKWELGVVEFFDSFEQYDQFTKLGAAYTAPTDRDGNTLTLDSDISSDYRNAPYYLWGRMNSRVAGANFWVGPSTDADFEGAIEAQTVKGFSSGTVLTLLENSAYAFYGPLSSDYTSGDPVIIRTVPLGWTPYSALETLGMGAMPIARYNENYLRSQFASATGAVEIDAASAYKYFNQQGLRLVCDDSSEDTDRYLYRLTPVNSINPRMTRWRASWYYRVGRAGVTLPDAPSSVIGNISLDACTADGNIVTTLSNEAAGNTGSGLSSYTYYSGYDEWGFDSNTVGFGSSNDYNLLAADNPNDAATTRINRFKVKIGLHRGLNTAFDIDDFIIEHAHGTSQEDNGYFEIDKFPEQGSVNWRFRRNGTNSYPLGDNSLKQVTTTGNVKPKHIVSASFENVSTQTYLDVVNLMGWHDRGKMIALRPYHNQLPNVMVGMLQIDSFNNQFWDLGKVSFTLRFEEA
jgi:hypothetical protein